MASMPDFSHRGHRKRASVVPVLGYPGYFLHRFRNRHGERAVKKVAAHASDANREAFMMDFCIRRRLRGRKQGWAKRALTLTL